MDRPIEETVVQTSEVPFQIARYMTEAFMGYETCEAWSNRLTCRLPAVLPVEESAPPSPTIGPTPNFDQVAPGIYRSSFPRAGNFEHLRAYDFKTILTLVGHDYPADNVKFLKDNDINHFQIALPAHKDPTIKIPTESVQRALQIILDRRNHPILIHCNKGKHRTGCIVACYRKLHDVPLSRIIAEYRKYASNKARTLDEKFIEEFDETTIMGGLMKSTMVAEAIETTYKPLDQLLTPPPSTKDGSLRDYHELEDSSIIFNRTTRGDSKASSSWSPL